MAKLVLFDLDDTILGSVGNRNGLWAEMFTEVFGMKDPPVMKRWDGMTEREIILDVTAEGGIDEETAKKKLHHAFRVLKEKFSQLDVMVYPGVMGLLVTMKEAEEIKMGVLTGNAEDRGWMKLEKAGLKDYFRFGVFAEDAETREGLFQAAMEKAEKAFGMRFDPKDVWIIGDTPRDVSTAVKNGARCIAVATGPFSERELISEGPDFVLKDLTDYKRIISIILGKED